MIFDATDVVSLSYADMRVEIIDSGHGVAANLRNLLIDLLASILLNLLKLISLSPVLLQEHGTNDFNRVTSFANIGDLLLGAICDSRVGH